MAKLAVTSTSAEATASSPILAFDAFQLDLQDLELTYAGTLLKVDPLVLRLLAVLLERAGEVVTKQELLAHVWDSRVVSENVLTVTMTRLRKVLQVSGRSDFVATSFGRGYRFVPPVVRCERKVGPHKGDSAGLSSATELVGRDSVLNAVRSLWSEIVSGRGHAVLVCGEPGIGKTSTVDLLAREAQAAGFAVSWAYCRERGTAPPLWPFMQLVRNTLAKVTLDRSDERLAAGMRELSRLVPDLDPSVHGAAPSPVQGLVDPGARHRLFDAVTQLLLAAASARPCVLVLEDLHQADAATFELLRYLIDELTDARLLVLATLRHPLPSSRTGVRQMRTQRNCTVYELERLNEAEVTSYVSASTGVTASSFGRTIFLRSQGNPFIMHEFLRQLAADPSLDPGALTFSNAALELASERLRQLEPALRELLETAAVIGPTFELPLLEIAAGIDRDALMSSLEAAWATGVIVAAPDSRTAFAFDHELLREALHKGLPPARCRSIHLAIARALEERSKNSGSIPICALAYHYSAAMPQTDLRACVHYCGAAAEAASQSFAYADGVRYLHQAIEALDLLPNGSPRLRLKLKFAQVLLARACSGPGQESLLGEVLSMALTQGDSLTLARAAFLADLHPGFPSIAGARQALEDALAMLPASERALRSALLARSATSAPEAYDSERSTARIASAFELIADLDAPFAHYCALSAQLYLHGGPAQRVESAERLRELESFCSQQPKLYSVPPAFFELHRAIAAQQDGDLATRDAALLRCERLTRKLGSRELLWHCERFQALARLNAGNMEASASQLRALHRRAREDSLVGTRLMCLYDQLVVFGEGPVHVRDAMAEALSFEPAATPSLWSIQVRVLATAGLIHEARVALSMVPASSLARLPCDRDFLGTLGALARAVLLIDAPDYAEALYDLLAPFPDRFAAHVSFHCEGSVAQLLGLLAGSLGRRAEASERLTAGIELCERAGFGRCAGEARRELAGFREC